MPPSDYDLWLLYRMIRRCKPRTVLEFGVGCSTLVIAEALRRNGYGVLYSVDASKEWLDRLDANIPAALRGIARLQQSGLEIIEWKGERAHRYTDVPDVTPDLLYLDGPDPRDVPDWSGGPLAADPILMEHKFPVGFRMIVDSRAANCAMLDQHLTRRYRKRHDDIFKITTYDLLH